MKTYSPTKEKEIIQIFEHFNNCHDASMRSVRFSKERTFDEEDGSLIYPEARILDQKYAHIDTQLEIELLLNSYVGAKKDQLVTFEFKQTREFTFTQKTNYDFSEISEVVFKGKRKQGLLFDVYVTDARILALSIICKGFTCREL